MTYSCSDFVDSILDRLGIVVPDKDADNPSAQANLALAAINALEKGEPCYPMAKHAKDLRAGDMIDLEGDHYADPTHNPAYECELCLVAGAEVETPECVRIDFEGLSSIGFPPDHLLSVHGHDAEYEAASA